MTSHDSQKRPLRSARTCTNTDVCLPTISRPLPRACLPPSNHHEQSAAARRNQRFIRCVSSSRSRRDFFTRFFFVLSCLNERAGVREKGHAKSCCSKTHSSRTRSSTTAHEASNGMIAGRSTQDGTHGRRTQDSGRKHVLSFSYNVKRGVDLCRASVSIGFRFDRRFLPSRHPARPLHKCLIFFAPRHAKSSVSSMSSTGVPKRLHGGYVPETRDVSSAAVYHSAEISTQSSSCTSPDTASFKRPQQHLFSRPEPLPIFPTTASASPLHAKASTSPLSYVPASASSC